MDFCTAELSDGSSIEYTAEELRLQALTSISAHSSPSTSLVHSPELSRRLAGEQSASSPLQSHRKNIDSKPPSSPSSRFFTSPIKDSGLKDKKFSSFSSPFNRRKDRPKHLKDGKEVDSPLTIRKGSDTGSTSSGGIHSPRSIPQYTTQYSVPDSEFISVRHSPSVELYGTRHREGLERGGSSPSLSRCMSAEHSPIRGSEAAAYTQHRSITFSSFKRSPSHDPNATRRTSSPSQQDALPSYRIHRAITQPISENYDYAYVYQIDRVIGTTQAVIETREERPKRSRSTGTDIHGPESSVSSTLNVSTPCVGDDSRSPKRHTPPSNTPPEAHSPKRRQCDQSTETTCRHSTHTTHQITQTQIVIEDRCSPVIDSSSKKDTDSNRKTSESSPTGTLDSVDLKDESKFGSSSTMSVGSEASPTTERTRARKTPAEKVAHFSSVSNEAVFLYWLP